MAAGPRDLRIVVMGVAGAGKSTVGRALAARLGAEFLDGDDLHPEANVRKMRAGIPLDDRDRAPWLERLGASLAAARAARRPLVLACSALRRDYRAQLRRGDPDLRLVWLDGPPELLRQRIGERAGHFMPAGLLDSQLATLEPPLSALRIDVAAGPDEIIGRILAELGPAAGGPPPASRH